MIVKYRGVALLIVVIGLLALVVVSGGVGASLTGTVTYRERIALTPGATLTVQLLDTSYADAPSEIIAKQIITDPGQVPIKFDIRYRRGDIDPGNTYSVSARIDEADGRLVFINDTSYEVITRGNPRRVDMVLVLVQPPPNMVDADWSVADLARVEEAVMITDSHMIWEDEGAYLRVAYLVSDTDGCYQLGREEATVDGSHISVEVLASVPPPAPWAIDCSDKNLELDSVVFLGDSLATGETYRVTINGDDSLNFTAP